MTDFALYAGIAMFTIGLFAFVALVVAVRCSPGLPDDDLYEDGEGPR